MSDMDNIFKEKLYHEETPLGAKTTFEGVMDRRKGRGAVLWYFNKYAISAAIVILAALIAYLAMPGNSGTNTENSNISKNQNSASSQSDKNINGPNAVITDGDRSVSSDNADGQNSARANDNSGISQPNTGNGQVSSPNNARDNTDIKDNQNGSESFPKPESPSPEMIIENELREAQQRKAIQDAWAKDVQEDWNNDLGWMMESQFPAFKNADIILNVAEPIQAEVNLWNNEFGPRNISPWFIELNTSTAGIVNNKAKPGNTNIIGNHRFIQYQGLLLRDLGRGFLAGTGIGFNQSFGVGSYINTKYEQVQNIDTNTVIIVQPGLPDQTITVYDTSMVGQTTVKKGNINYNLSKVNVPIAMRYYFGSGKFIWRIGASVAPGLMVTQKGTMFNRTAMTESQNLKSNAFTMDSKLSAGVQYTISNTLSVFAEPVIQYQIIGHKEWMPYNKFGYGFGVGIIFKP